MNHIGKVDPIEKLIRVGLRSRHAAREVSSPAVASCCFSHQRRAPSPPSKTGGTRPSEGGARTLLRAQVSSRCAPTAGLRTPGAAASAAQRGSRLCWHGPARAGSGSIIMLSAPARRQLAQRRLSTEQETRMQPRHLSEQRTRSISHGIRSSRRNCC